MWKLWLDDQLDDPATPERHTPKGFVGAKNFAEAVELVLRMGIPTFMDLDHDLGIKSDGSPETAMVFVRWLEELMNGCCGEDSDFMPLRPPPNYNIHSCNPVGRENMDSFLQNWNYLATSDAFNFKKIK